MQLPVTFRAADHPQGTSEAWGILASPVLLDELPTSHHNAALRLRHLPATCCSHSTAFALAVPATRHALPASLPHVHTCTYALTNPWPSPTCHLRLTPSSLSSCSWTKGRASAGPVSSVWRGEGLIHLCLFPSSTGPGPTGSVANR